MGTERSRELRRRRARSKKLVKLTARAAKSNKTEKGVIIDKLRKLTPGADEVIGRLGLKD